MLSKKMRDYTGMRNGTLKAVRFSHIKRKTTYWFFICDCGKEFTARVTSIIGGHVSGCKERCEKQAVRGIPNKKLAENSIWEAMKRRCYNNSCKEFKYYGGRGITVCDRWRYSFKNFYTDLGPRPSPKHSIDRIDVNGNYEPGNCRWATAYIQSINQRIKSTNKSGYKGVIFLNKSKKWRATIRVNGKHKSLGCYGTKQGAIEARKKAEHELYHGISENDVHT